MLNWFFFANTSQIWSNWFFYFISTLVPVRVLIFRLSWYWMWSFTKLKKVIIFFFKTKKACKAVLDGLKNLFSGVFTEVPNPSQIIRFLSIKDFHIQQLGSQLPAIFSSTFIVRNKKKASITLSNCSWKFRKGKSTIPSSALHSFLYI